MAQFALLLYDNTASMAKLSPEEMQVALEKYMGWGKKPFTLASKRLGPDRGKTVRAENGQPRVKDGPYTETKEILGGFYLIEAPDYDAAVELTKNNPHVEYGGIVEVRQVWV